MQLCIWGWDSSNNQAVKVGVDAGGVVQASDPPDEGQNAEKSS